MYVNRRKLDRPARRILRFPFSLILCTLAKTLRSPVKNVLRSQDNFSSIRDGAKDARLRLGTTRELGPMIQEQI